MGSCCSSRCRIKTDAKKGGRCTVISALTGEALAVPDFMRALEVAEDGTGLGLGTGAMRPPSEGVASTSMPRSDSIDGGGGRDTRTRRSLDSSGTERGSAGSSPSLAHVPAGTTRGASSSSTVVPLGT
jgi:hypothetical protein